MHVSTILLLILTGLCDDPSPYQLQPLCTIRARRALWESGSEAISSAPLVNVSGRDYFSNMKRLSEQFSTDLPCIDLQLLRCPPIAWANGGHRLFVLPCNAAEVEAQLAPTCLFTLKPRWQLLYAPHHNTMMLNHKSAEQTPTAVLSMPGGVQGLASNHLRRSLLQAEEEFREWQNGEGMLELKIFPQRILNRHFTEFLQAELARRMQQKDGEPKALAARRKNALKWVNEWLIRFVADVSEICVEIDSIKVGEPIKVTLRIRLHRESPIGFPPREVVSRRRVNLKTTQPTEHSFIGRLRLSPQASSTLDFQVSSRFDSAFQSYDEMSTLDVVLTGDSTDQLVWIFCQSRSGSTGRHDGPNVLRSYRDPSLGLTFFQDGDHNLVCR